MPILTESLAPMTAAQAQLWIILLILYALLTTGAIVILAWLYRQERGRSATLRAIIRRNLRDAQSPTGMQYDWGA